MMDSSWFLSHTGSNDADGRSSRTSRSVSYGASKTSVRDCASVTVCDDDRFLVPHSSAQHGGIGDIPEEVTRSQQHVCPPGIPAHGVPQTIIRPARPSATRNAVTVRICLPNYFAAIRQVNLANAWRCLAFAGFARLIRSTAKYEQSLCHPMSSDDSLEFRRQ